MLRKWILLITEFQRDSGERFWVLEWVRKADVPICSGINGLRMKGVLGDHGLWCMIPIQIEGMMMIVLFASRWRYWWSICSFRPDIRVDLKLSFRGRRSGVSCLGHTIWKFPVDFCWWLIHGGLQVWSCSKYVDSLDFFRAIISIQNDLVCLITCLQVFFFPH